MIKQAELGLNSRSEANPFDEDGFLPLITAPVYSVVDDKNYEFFLKHGIRVCMPRKVCGENTVNWMGKEAYFEAVSLDEFIADYIESDQGMVYGYGGEYIKTTVLIDTASGNIPKLHNAIRKAKEIYSNKLVIMAGNVGSLEAFVELAEININYIRVGIGGSLNGCNTTKNTGVGQKNLYKLLKKCYKWKTKTGSNVKIVADGISTYCKWCEDKYGFLDNGYACINKLLQVSDMVMIGSLFAQVLESAGKKGFYHVYESGEEIKDLGIVSHNTNPNLLLETFNKNRLYVKYSGMSTTEAQKKYKWVGDKDASRSWLPEDFGKNPADFPELVIKPSEGSTKWLPVRFLLDEWLNGSQNQDEYPYLMGWVNSIKSAMSYVSAKTLKEFKI